MNVQRAILMTPGRTHPAISTPKKEMTNSITQDTAAKSSPVFNSKSFLGKGRSEPEPINISYPIMTPNRSLRLADNTTKKVELPALQLADQQSAIMQQQTKQSISQTPPTATVSHQRKARGTTVALDQRLARHSMIIIPGIKRELRPIHTMIITDNEDQLDSAKKRQGYTTTKYFSGNTIYSSGITNPTTVEPLGEKTQSRNMPRRRLYSENASEFIPTTQLFSSKEVQSPLIAARSQIPLVKSKSYFMGLRDNDMPVQPKSFADFNKDSSDYPNSQEYNTPNRTTNVKKELIPETFSDESDSSHRSKPQQQSLMSKKSRDCVDNSPISKFSPIHTRDFQVVHPKIIVPAGSSKKYS